MRYIQFNDIINAYTFNKHWDSHNNFLPSKPQLFHITSENIDSFVENHQISQGFFTDIYLGDILHINAKNYDFYWQIVGFDTELDSNIKLGSKGKHHLTLLPTRAIVKSYMNRYYNNTGGYVNSHIFLNIISDIDKALKSVLHKHLLSHVQKLPIDKNTDDFVLKSVKSVLLDKNQITNDTYQQLPYLHYHNNHKIIKNISSTCWWLRNPYHNEFNSMDYWHGVDKDGNVSIGDVTSSLGVRPIILIG